MLAKLIQNVQETAASDFSVLALKAFLIAWAIFVILAAITTNNKWLLAGLLAYEILP